MRPDYPSRAGLDGQSQAVARDRGDRVPDTCLAGPNAGTLTQAQPDVREGEAASDPAAPALIAFLRDEPLRPSPPGVASRAVPAYRPGHCDGTPRPV